MTITEVNPVTRIKMRLDFKKPFEGTDDVEFTFKPEGEKTVVTWTMTGKKTLMFKAIGLFMDCEKMCGDDFDAGLANLGKVLAAAPAAAAAVAPATVPAGIPAPIIPPVIPPAPAPPAPVK